MNQRNGILVAAFLTASAIGFGCGRHRPAETPAPVDRPTVAMPSESRPAPGGGGTSAGPGSERWDAISRRMAVLTEMVHFDFDRSDIRVSDRKVLEAKIELLREDPAMHLRIEGHADERGSDEYNVALGMRRASAVKRYLVQHGLDANRFEVVSFGEERPLQPKSTEEAWAANRRSEFYMEGGGLR